MPISLLACAKAVVHLEYRQGECRLLTIIHFADK